MDEDEEKAHVLALKDEYTKRLRALELQEARYGKDCPPHVLVEMRDLESTIEKLDVRIKVATEEDPEQLFSDANRYYLLGEIGYALQLYYKVKRIAPDFPGILTKIRDTEREFNLGYVDSGRVNERMLLLWREVRQRQDDIAQQQKELFQMLEAFAYNSSGIAARIGEQIGEGQREIADAQINFWNSLLERQTLTRSQVREVQDLLDWKLTDYRDSLVRVNSLTSRQERWVRYVRWLPILVVALNIVVVYLLRYMGWL